MRDAHPKADIGILGYPHIAAIADKRFYADAVRSIEYAALSRFFARGAELPDELSDYFAGFDLILSYLYDPDRIFEGNLRRCGVENILRGPSKIVSGISATEQLAQPVRELGIDVNDLAARIFPCPKDQEFARGFLEHCEHPILAIHPGSGSESKNWPTERWIEFVAAVLREGQTSSNGCLRTILIVSGEADESAIKRLRPRFGSDPRVLFAHALPLPQLAAILSQSTFIGHDSGISHLAAAAGARCILLFGPTDPNVWAPRNKQVTVLRAPNGDLAQLAVAAVRDAVQARF